MKVRYATWTKRDARNGPETRRGVHSCKHATVERTRVSPRKRSADASRESCHMTPRRWKRTAPRGRRKRWNPTSSSGFWEMRHRNSPARTPGSTDTNSADIMMRRDALIASKRSTAARALRLHFFGPNQSERSAESHSRRDALGHQRTSNWILRCAQNDSRKVKLPLPFDRFSRLRPSAFQRFRDFAPASVLPRLSKSGRGAHSAETKSGPWRDRVRTCTRPCPHRHATTSALCRDHVRTVARPCSDFGSTRCARRPDSSRVVARLRLRRGLFRPSGSR